MMLGRIRGRRIHFAGSADQDVEPSKLRYFHKLVKHIAKRTLAEGGGLIITVGSEPIHQSEHDLPLIFDWTLLEALDEYQNSSLLDWPETQGVPVVAVGLPKWRDRMPDNRKPLWKRVISTKNVELVQVRSELSVGGVLRERQAALGDVLVVAGGGPGVEHLAELYMSSRKPVVPLDIQLKTTKPGAAERLSTLAMESPERFFEYCPPEQAAAAYSMLSLKNQLPNVEDFEKRFFDFVFHLSRPRAFFARLLNKKSPEFDEVERFFRNVVDCVVRDAGYERFEVGTEVSKEAFLNVEIFQTIYSSSLVIVDLTGLRPNCFTELGYALGLKKKVIVTAQEGTSLPFDSASLPCHFWSPKKVDDQRRIDFQEFMRKNINRRPIVS
jgi:hypothetical protein